MTFVGKTYHNHREMVGERTGKTDAEHCVPSTHENDDGGRDSRWQRQDVYKRQADHAAAV
ncbi:hypothetical protein DEO72_LG3g742 [Vigna unguiculata]|uniref:Uncharacterized protein n=1 Tax=Vigna unguiculata TaxID=3917 RepID=A0A4D6LCB8_VIGUN|nr:hypothetical protein DEO72_LG3g742 [Vigna unguiculata]